MWIDQVQAFNSFKIVNIVVTGKSERAARKLLSPIRENYCKARHHYITIGDFCDYTGVGEEEVRRVING